MSKSKKKAKTATTPKASVPVKEKKELTYDGKPITMPKLTEQLLSDLAAATKAKNSIECKRIRGKLRRVCKHYGGLRNRTWIDKPTGVKHEVNAKPVAATKKK